MIRNNEYLGLLECAVEDEIIVGMPCSIKLTYHVGKYGIDDGGSIQFVRQGLTDWQNYQTENKTGLGYSTVKTTGKAKVRFVKNAEGIRPYENSIRVEVFDGCLIEGDIVEVVLGDRTYGSTGILSQSFVESQHKILLMIDPFGGNRYEEVFPKVSIEVKNGMCGEFHLVLPSTVEVNEVFDLKIRVIDDYGNRCSDFEGKIKLLVPEGFECQEEIEIHKDDNGVKLIPCKIIKDGIYRIKGIMETYEISSISNTVKTITKDEYRLFWGDMHGQNNVASGVGNMDEYLSFAKEVGALDFTGWQGNDFEISDSDWDTVNEHIKKYHKPGEFVTFLGYEWSGVSAAGGDHNIYFLNDDEKIHRTSQWLVNTGTGHVGYGKDNDGSDCYPISNLWERYKGRNDVMAIPHIGGRHANLDYFNSDFISMIEIHSHHGTFEWFIEEAMKRKLKVGFIGTSDDHSCRIGLSYPIVTFADDFGATFDVKSGLTAVYAKDLTRESLWEAFKSRRCYATTASRIILNYDIDGFEMGSEINLSKKPQLNIQVSGNAPLDHVEIYRGTKLIKRINSNIRDEEAKKKGLN